MNRRSFLSFLGLSAIASRLGVKGEAAAPKVIHPIDGQRRYYEIKPEYTLPVDTRIVYVSSSRGDDSNDGLSPYRPTRTLSAAKAKARHARPYWISDDGLEITWP